MPKDFNYWKKQNDSDELKEFNTDKLGTLWLKIKSIVRREYINKFIDANEIVLSSTGLNGQFIELYRELSKSIDDSHNILNAFIRNENIEALNSLDTDSLVQELYKVDTFKWGADNQYN